MAKDWHQQQEEIEEKEAYLWAEYNGRCCLAFRNPLDLMLLKEEELSPEQTAEEVVDNLKRKD